MRKLREARIKNSAFFIPPSAFTMRLGEQTPDPFCLLHTFNPHT
jgi:hypothetical protein